MVLTAQFIGTRRRITKCTDITTNMNMHPILCDAKTKPPEVESCQLFCPGKCVLSDWITWDNCSQACTMTKYGVRIRQRYVIKQGTSKAPCPSLEEIEQCGECFVYELRPTAWSSCILQNGTYS